MEDLRVPQKTLDDFFELLDYQRDLLALKAGAEQMQAKLAKIKIATSDPNSVDTIIDDNSSSLTTTYSSEKIEELFNSVTSDTVTAKEKIVTAINGKKPACNAKVSDTWDTLAFYITLMGNLQFSFTETVLNKVRVANIVPACVLTDIKNPYGSMSNPLTYKTTPSGGINLSVSGDAVNVTSGENTNVANQVQVNISVYLGGIRLY